MQKKVLNYEVLKDFKKHLISEEKSAATIEKYIRDIKAFAVYMNGAEITKEAVIEYKQKLQSKYKIRSINSVLASLNCLFNCFGWYNLKVKSLKLQAEIYRPEEKELSREEYQRLCKAAKCNKNARLNLILQTICGTGIRVSELPFITLEAAKKGRATVNCKNKTRTVFIVRELQEKLIKYAKRCGIESGMIFITKSGKAISRTNIWREMKNLCVQAGCRSPKSISA